MRRARALLNSLWLVPLALLPCLPLRSRAEPSALLDASTEARVSTQSGAGPLVESRTRSPVVFIAAGWFTFGATEDDLEQARRLCVSERIPVALRLRGCASEELFAAELPARRVYLSAYGMDRYEVSRAELSRCVDAGLCDPASYVTEQPGLTQPGQPAIGLSWPSARALCAFRGGRLPSEAEWERAARGDSARRFPWGTFYNGALANHGMPSLSFDPLAGAPAADDGYEYLAPVAAFEASASPHGLVQMAGNVWEWTADSFASVRAQPLSIDPTVQLDNGLRTVRGGSFRSPALALRITHREGRSEARGFVDVGVRCAYDFH
ncbi:MAG: Sulfatase modifying factor 1 precursor [Myxococcaceae bacterium]|nr:Sulfatase modifying factor 1 precursor [Myxococcaceae bacterium]